jgi:uncharacterized membrane protein
LQVHEEFRMSVGVLTDPKSLAEYEQAAPGSAAKILEKFFDQVGREQEHRHAIEREQLASAKEYDVHAQRQGDRGQWMALVVAIVGFVLVGWLAYIKEAALAGVIGTLDLGGLVSVFVYGKKKQTEEAIAETRLLSEPERNSAANSIPPEKDAPSSDMIATSERREKHGEAEAR